MSMTGQYVRLSSAELARALDDPDWAAGFVAEVQDATEEADPSPEQARYLTTDKAWHAIDFLLRRVDFPVDVVFGERPFAEDEDWGYGPPRYLAPERVSVAARALATMTFDETVAGVDRADLDREKIYPQVRDEPDALSWIRGWYEPLVSFVTAGGERRRGRPRLASVNDLREAPQGPTLPEHHLAGNHSRPRPPAPRSRRSGGDGRRRGLHQFPNSRLIRELV